MTILITGGNGNLSNCLKEYIDGDFYGKDMLDLTDRNCVKNLPLYDMLIHTATGTNININLQLLYSKAKKIFAFTSKQGTFLNWKKSGHIDYGIEKLNLNFITYRHNLQNRNAQLFEPGHMESIEHYDAVAKKFSELYKNWKFEKNMIYDLSQNGYIGY
jgi:hypothetical protein